MIYLDLFLGFLRVGLFSFGGAYSAIPLIRDVVRAYGWLSDEELSYMIAVSESTPGPIMVNLATYVGSNQGGVLGALLATVAVVLPAFFIILLVVTVLNKILNTRYVQAALGGITPAVIGIILATGVFMTLGCVFPAFTAAFAIPEPGAPDFRALILAAVLSLLYFGWKPVFHKRLSPVVLILISAALGMVIF